eukprot:3260734-Pyramimonas_sp.AAC.1
MSGTDRAASRGDVLLSGHARRDIARLIRLQEETNRGDSATQLTGRSKDHLRFALIGAGTHHP